MTLISSIKIQNAIDFLENIGNLKSIMRVRGARPKFIQSSGGIKMDRSNQMMSYGRKIGD